MARPPLGSVALARAFLWLLPHLLLPLLLHLHRCFLSPLQSRPPWRQCFMSPLQPRPPCCLCLLSLLQLPLRPP